MRFYTNVQMVGDNFLVRGYEDGKHFTGRGCNPFVDSPQKKTNYRTLNGDHVAKLNQELYGNLEILSKSTMKFKTSMSMVMSVLSISIFQISILKKN